MCCLPCCSRAQPPGLCQRMVMVMRERDEGGVALHGHASQAPSAVVAGVADVAIISSLCHAAQVSTCGVALGMRSSSPKETNSLLHYKSGHHADHALIGFSVTEDMAVPRPRAGVVGVNEHREALTGFDRTACRLDTAGAPHRRLPRSPPGLCRAGAWGGPSGLRSYTGPRSSFPEWRRAGLPIAADRSAGGPDGRG